MMSALPIRFLSGCGMRLGIRREIGDGSEGRLMNIPEGMRIRSAGAAAGVMTNKRAEPKARALSSGAYSRAALLRNYTISVIPAISLKPAIIDSFGTTFYLKIANPIPISCSAIPLTLKFSSGRTAAYSA